MLERVECGEAINVARGNIFGAVDQPLLSCGVVSGSDLAGRKNQGLKRRPKGTLIISCLQVRVLPAPPRILVLTEISPNPATSPELAGLPSEILSLRRRP